MERFEWKKIQDDAQTAQNTNRNEQKQSTIIVLLSEILERLWLLGSSAKQ
jgi:hypothetical protein